MRSGTTVESNAEIVKQLVSPHCRTALKLELYIDGSPENIEDFDVQKGVDWSESGKNQKYANTSLIPLPGTVRFQVDNVNAKYSPGSGSYLENTLDIGTKIRLSSGYFLQEPLDQVENSFILNKTSGLIIGSYFYNTQFNTSYVEWGQYGGTITHFTDLFNPLYDSETYDDSTYTPGGYTVQTYDSGDQEYESINGFKITTDTTNGLIYYRTLNDANNLGDSVSSEWTLYGPTINGEISVDIPDVNDRFLQVGVIFDGMSYTDVAKVTSIKVQVQSYIDWIYQSVYYLDNPSFDDPPAPLAPKVFCDGRDAFKLAIDTDVNLPDLSSLNRTPDELAKYICDQIGLGYSSTSIDDLSSFGNITWAGGFGDIKKASQVFEKIMEKINSGSYLMYLKYDKTLDDNILYITKQPNTSLEADGAFSYKNYISIGASRRNGDKAIMRMTVLTDTQVVKAEELLDTETITSVGVTTFTWTGNAVYKRFTADLPANIKGTVVITPTSAALTVTEITGTVVVEIHGCKWDSTNPTYEGEAINFNNMMAGTGTTARSINPLMESDAECKSVAESLSDDFAEPIQEAQGLKYPYLNLIPELNDSFVLWRRYFLDDNIYSINKINHHWDESENPRQTTSFNLEDTGRNFSETSNFIYDDTPNPMKYDSGWIYDMGISTPQSTPEEIEAATKYTYNVDFIHS
jgi:hypothetical protein